MIRTILKHIGATLLCIVLLPLFLVLGALVGFVNCAELIKEFYEYIVKGDDYA